MAIPIIDLFAGPGGLGEGFTSVRDGHGKPVFEIKLSIEKDESAHKTLTWRSFYRQFINKGKTLPDEYYQAYQEKDLKKREEIIEQALSEYPEGKIAREEACLVELGSKKWPSSKVDNLIINQIGQKPDKWVLIGGPPCQAYSNAGRSRVGGIRKDDHRVYLYKEYLRIIKKHSPSVFVMENVKGLLSAKVGEEKVFDWIKKDLQVGGKYELHSFVKPATKDSDYLIKSELYGIPQKRHRVILLGIRKDLEHKGEYLEKTDQVNLDSVIGKLPIIRSGLNREFVSYDYLHSNNNGKPKRVYTQLKDSDLLWEDYVNQFLSRIKKWDITPLNGLSKGISASKLSIGGEFIKCDSSLEDNHPLHEWYKSLNHQGFEIWKLAGIANHESRAHLTQDLMRYLFASLYVEKNDTFPRLKDYAKHAKELVPDHENVNSGKFTDRFRVQLKNKPATTITSHISKDGHYFIHYDPKQCRSLTVREAARIQTFPDNYLFRGSRTQQFHQVGNAVPPHLAYKMGKIVASMLDQ
ncbi:DNA cytosine methyltransferase [Fulvivirga sedimenti]|uniref:DNA (cytosine-5-)-methyltransferase n=1 Tax=Fulvivirga sedimenti TaxID=2879465 RepID=A0A9X1HPR9_9BACT|nr:DNA cytosine methyltransferase [Fulvivirga sedimenti]MCA6075596.1 DNA cytosine methyltransferase [Fulvivirga sedimenti]